MSDLDRRALVPIRSAGHRPADRRFRRLNDLIVVAEYEGALKANQLDSLDALFAVANDRRLDKPGLEAWRHRLELSVALDGERRVLFLKRFDHPPRSARRQVRKSGSGASSLAGAEWAWMLRLSSDGIPSPKPVAFGEMLRGGKEIRSAVLSEAVPGRALEHWVQKWDERDRPVIRRLIPATARLIARLHRCGYVHRDLYLSHIFYDPSGQNQSTIDDRQSTIVDPAAHRPQAAHGAAPSNVRGSATPLPYGRGSENATADPQDRGNRSFRLCLIDLQRVMRPSWWKQRWVVKDLAALHYAAPAPLITRTDRLRWLTAYLGVRKLDAPARRCVYLVIGKARRIAAHDRRRRRRLGSGAA